jgi:hypothetical protein
MGSLLISHAIGDATLGPKDILSIDNADFGWKANLLHYDVLSSKDIVLTRLASEWSNRPSCPGSLFGSGD